MCLKLKDVSAEDVRLRLLREYEVGTIALGAHDLRVAFSCIAEEYLEDLFNLIYQAVQDVKKG